MKLWKGFEYIPAKVSDILHEYFSYINKVTFAEERGITEQTVKTKLAKHYLI